MASSLSLGDPGLDDRLRKSDTLEKVTFEASVDESVQAVFKADDDFIIWGPASVEIVDKEGDKISIEALDKALPQLLKRARLSLEHTDQIVGRILERFRTEQPVQIEINGQTYTRQEFPTDVLDLDDDSPAALYVAGEIYDDTQQSKRARRRIEEGELTSYSISGEALVTRKQVDGGEVYDDIVDMDLSAVTLCEEGMNQGAKYARVDGEVDDKVLAGEVDDEDVSKRQEVPVLQHPSTRGVNSAAKEASEVSKNMSNDDNENGEEPDEDEEKKSNGPTLEDVMKKLPDDGELATKEDVKSEAEKAVDASLPDGDLATVESMERMVKQEVQSELDKDAVDVKSLGNFVGDTLGVESEKAHEFINEEVDGALARAMWEDLNATREVAASADGLQEFAEQFKQDYGPSQASVDAPTHNGNYGGEGSGTSPASSETEESGDVSQGSDSHSRSGDGESNDSTREPNQGSETQDYGGVETTSSKSDGEVTVATARDKVAREFGVEPDKVTRAMNQLLAGDSGKGDDADERVEVVEPEDEEDEDEKDEFPSDDEEDEEIPEDATPSDEEDGEGDEYQRILERLEDQLPEDVWKVVREYVKSDADPDEIDAPSDILEASEDGDEPSDDLEKTVRDILDGGAEVQGGQAIPTAPNEDQVEKQYSDGEEGEGEGELATKAEESPALSNFYG